MKLRVATATHEELVEYVRTSTRQTVSAAIKKHKGTDVHDRLCLARDEVVESRKNERPATVERRRKEASRADQIAKDTASEDYKTSKYCPMHAGIRVSPSGRVWSDYHRRFLSPSVTSAGKGYLHVNLATRNEYIHRLVALTFLPNPDNKPTVNHKDGNPRNNHVSNLEWATRKEQIAHALREGLFGACKLTDTQVREIRASSKLQKDLAVEYGMSVGAIGCIVRGETYAHVI